MLFAPYSLGFSWYRSSGMLQDELVVKVGRLRTQMRGKDAKQMVQSLLDELASATRATDTDQAVVERSVLLRFPPSSIGPVPEARTFADEISVQQAWWKLKTFRIVSQLVTVSLLAWLGMSELYEGKPTFGATPITDYLGLFAWGFGAEVSREAIVKATGNLGLVNGQSEKSSES
jgi:hypothetical protein